MSSPRTIFLALVLALSPLARAEETPLYFGLQTADIPIVHTGKELLKLPPIIDNDRTLHIAIERTECKLNEGALIYVAVEAPAAPATAPAPATAARRVATRLEPLRNRLGPVLLDIQRLDSKEAVDTPMNLIRDTYRDANFPQNQTPLYLGIIQSTRPGKYAIRILSTDGNLLAKTTLTVAEESVQPWLFVDFTEFDSDAKEPLKATVNGLLARVAYPTRYPIPLPDSDLPQLLPGKESADLKIDAHDSLVSVTLDGPITDSDAPFLARILINGKQPNASLSDFNRFRNANPARGVKSAKSSTKFDIALDLSPFDPQPGDRITLQLAYSSLGTEQVDNPMLRSARRQSLNKSIDPILVSNSITFTYTPAPPAASAPATAP